ncbi:hypothetical protein BDW66DRAFT_150852 [Aspergillus desertorum]
MCHGDRTVSSEVSGDPTKAPYKVFKDLYERKETEECPGLAVDEKHVKSDELRKAKECGNWGGAEPSRLFLRIYHDALATLGRNPLGGVVSPPLMGSNGVVPLTIVAPLPDICRHMANCIARAQKEVFLATNYWIFSDASTLITNALKELSRRAGERGDKVVVKILYDRGDPKQVWENRLTVDEKKYTTGKVSLPAAGEIPHLDMQVINYHRPIFGTFHAKFMIVDRRVALLQSNNIQDNDNLEMMIRVEGAIVDSLYDTALISWGKALDPPLPMLYSPAVEAPLPSAQVYFSSHCEENGILPQHTTGDEHYDADIAAETRRVNGQLTPTNGETRAQPVTRLLNHTRQKSTTGDAPDGDQEDQMEPYILTPQHKPFPMALVNREPYGSPDHTSTAVPQNAAWLAAVNHAERSIFIQTPNLNAEPLLEPLLGAVRRGIIVTCYLCLGYNDAGQLLPFQNGTNEMISSRLYTSLETDEEKSRLRIFNYVAKDQTRPIHNKFKKRSCHIKLMIVDETVAIQGASPNSSPLEALTNKHHNPLGNGNLDTQSYYHSQEVNLLLDSPLVCRTWLDALARNQNTAKYGLVSPDDGCWHDPATGEIPEGSIGLDPGRFSWAKGAVGVVHRVRGTGGF